jgi:hypothetical protein
MYDPPAYIWVLTIAGPTAMAAATCIALYSGTVRAGLGRRRAALLGGAAAVLLGGWYTATAVIAALLVALRLAQGTGRRAAVWFNAYGLTDLAVGITLGALTSYGLLHVTPSTAPISQLPLALVIAADVPLMIALHITSLVTLARTSRPAPSAAGPLISGTTPRAAATPGPARGG